MTRRQKKIAGSSNRHRRAGASRRVGAVRAREEVKADKVKPIEVAILRTLPDPPAHMAFDDLVDGVAKQVNPLVFPLRKTVSRYTKVVQLELEKRGVIERVPGVTPLHLRRLKNS